jgi:hypothetical protein
MTVLYKEGATKAQEDEAQWILEALDFAYPDHPWSVRVYPGGFFIRHMNLDATWGMNCRGSYASASLLKKDVILKAGEFLERAGLPRSRWDFENDIKRVEGVPEKWQPEPEVSKLPAVNFEKVIATAERETRDVPMPEIAK